MNAGALPRQGWVFREREVLEKILESMPGSGGATAQKLKKALMAETFSCPSCGSDETFFEHFSRRMSGESWRPRYICRSCSHRWTLAASRFRSSSSLEHRRAVEAVKRTLEVCPFCGSSNTRFDYFNNKSFTKSRFRCRDCKKRFTPRSRRRKPQASNPRSAHQAQQQDELMKTMNCMQQQVFENGFKAPTMMFPVPLSGENWLGFETRQQQPWGERELVENDHQPAFPGEILEAGPSFLTLLEACSSLQFLESNQRGCSVVDSSAEKKLDFLEEVQELEKLVNELKRGKGCTDLNPNMNLKHCSSLQFLESNQRDCSVVDSFAEKKLDFLEEVQELEKLVNELKRGKRCTDLNPNINLRHCSATTSVQKKTGR